MALFVTMYMVLLQINSEIMQREFAAMQERLNWNYYQYFLKVAECGNLASAAREMGVNHSTVFRRINNLEQQLNIRLFERSRNGYTLTEVGEEIFERVRQVEEQMYAIQRKLVGKDLQLNGTLKVSTTDTIGYYWLPPYIKKFKERYPDIVMDIEIKTRYTDLKKREADIVIPAVNLQPDYMVGRSLAPIYFKLYASINYVAQYGVPSSTKEFPNHRFIVPNEALGEISASIWLRKHVPEKCIIATSDKLSTLFKFAQQDLGIAALPHYVGQSDGNMVELLELPADCHRNIWILTHPDLRDTARIKVFMQFMYEQVVRKQN